MAGESWVKQQAGMKDVQWLVKLLQETLLFDQKSMAGPLAAECELFTAAKGSALVKEGESSTDFFFLYDGTITVQRGGESVAQLGPGSFFGEMALLVNGQKRFATIKADGPVRFFVLRSANFQRLVAQNKELGTLLKAAAEARRDGFRG